MTFEAKEIHRAMVLIEKVNPVINTARASISELVTVINLMRLNETWNILGGEDALFLKDFRRRWKASNQI